VEILPKKLQQKLQAELATLYGSFFYSIVVVVVVVFIFVIIIFFFLLLFILICMLTCRNLRTRSFLFGYENFQRLA
jgi:hypothetical protein